MWNKAFYSKDSFISASTTVAASAITITIPAVSGKYNYVYKVTGYTDLANALVTISTSGKDSWIEKVASDGRFSIDVDGLYSGTIGLAITVSVGCTTTGRLNVVAEAVTS